MGFSFDADDEAAEVEAEAEAEVEPPLAKCRWAKKTMTAMSATPSNT